MARLESVALGGFFATPPHLIPIIASHLRFSFPPPPESRYETDYAHVSILDPCAGAGDALEALCDAVGDERVEAYAVELEETRAKACTDVVRPRSRRSHNAHGYRPNPLTGDAFRVQFRTSDDGGVSALYLNPPYDHDKVFKRLEARWLDRWTSALRTDGVLVFVIPFYVLGACAEHLATHYTCIRAYRFPGDDFRAFQQCVVFAHKVDARMAPDPALLALVQGWDADGATMDELRQRSRPLYDVPVGKNYGGAFDEWVMRDVDFHSVLAQYKPWHVHLRGGAKAVPIPGLIPDGRSATASSASTRWRRLRGRRTSRPASRPASSTGRASSRTRTGRSCRTFWSKAASTASTRPSTRSRTSTGTSPARSRCSSRSSS